MELPKSGSETSNALDNSTSVKEIELLNGTISQELKQTVPTSNNSIFIAKIKKDIVWGKEGESFVLFLKICIFV